MARKYQGGKVTVVIEGYKGGTLNYKIEKLFDGKAAEFEAVVALNDSHAAALDAVLGLLNQAMFPSLDAAAAYALMRDRKPQHQIEVGSRQSTRVQAKSKGGLG